MSQCNTCDSHVTASFHRVFADNDGTLHGCIECMTLSEINDGHATGL